MHISLPTALFLKLKFAKDESLYELVFCFVVLFNSSVLSLTWFAEVQNSDPEFDAYRDETYRMLLAGFPMNHPYLQKNLRFHVQDRIKGLRRGCVPLEKSFYLMGTADPTQERILKPNQVAIAM